MDALFKARFDDLVYRESHRRAEKIERELLTHDVVAVAMTNGQHVIYRIPRWREAPIRRAKIAYYRWRRRRELARLRTSG